MTRTLETRDDADLVASALAGDRAAFGVLYERHRPLLRGLCLRALGDTALVEDALQEAALQALLNLGALRQPERFGAWLGGIGLNVCRALLRRRGKADWSWEAIVGGRASWEPVDGAPSPCQAAEAAELRTAVRLAVAGLPRGQRAAVLLFYLRGLTYAETAAALGIEVGAVRTRLHKARQSLREPLQHIGAWEAMTAKSDGHYIPVRVTDVLAGGVAPDTPGAHIVVLESLDGGETVPIWIGPQEGIAIALLLEDVRPPRPLTYTFMAAALAAAGVRVREVRITRLAADTYYAATLIEAANGVAEVDARPSDAIALALCTGAPIVVERAIFPLAANLRDRFQPAGEATAKRGRNAAAIAADVQRLWSTASPAPDDEGNEG